MDWRLSWHHERKNALYDWRTAGVFWSRIEIRCMKNKVAVAIPTYNRLAYLKECIESILNQMFQDFSLFVFDNASDEPVEQELQKYQDERLHFIGSTQNTGPVGNINRILEYPFDSEYVAIFHDDDAMHPKKLELQSSFLDAHQDVLFVASDFNEVSDKTIHAFAGFDENNVKSAMYKNPYEFVRAEMSWLRCAFGSVMYRKNAFLAGRMQADKFSEFADLVFLMGISKKGPCAFLKAPLMNYRIHPGQNRVLGQEYEQGAMEMLSFCRESLPAALDKKDEMLLRRYSVNFLLRACAHINKGFFYSLRFLQKCHQQQFIRYRDFRYIDAHGLVSAVSIVLKSKKIISAARWARSLFRL